MKIKLKTVGEPVEFEELKPGDVFDDCLECCMMMLPDGSCLDLLEMYVEPAKYEQSFGPFTRYPNAKLVLK